MTATIYGKHARVFGVANPFFDPEFESWSPQKKAAVHRHYGYKKTEIWWGGKPGDWQLLWSKTPKRLSDNAVERKVRRTCRANGTTKERVAEIIAYLRERRIEYAPQIRKARTSFSKTEGH